MRRYQLVIGGTVAGVAAVLAFPTHRASLKVPTASASSSGTPTTAGGTTSTTSAPPAAGGATSATTSPPTTAQAAATRSATSSTQSDQYGDIAVRVTVTGSKITGIKIASIDETDSRSEQIDRYAVPQLEQQVLDAGSPNIDGVSGATFTSQAFVNAVADALNKLGVSS